jgi:hypothetical protein
VRGADQSANWHIEDGKYQCRSVRRAPRPLLDRQPNFASAIDSEWPSAGLVVVKRRSPLPAETRDVYRDDRAEEKVAGLQRR